MLVHSEDLKAAVLPATGPETLPGPGTEQHLCDPDLAHCGAEQCGAGRHLDNIPPLPPGSSHHQALLPGEDALRLPGPDSLLHPPLPVVRSSLPAPPLPRNGALVQDGGHPGTGQLQETRLLWILSQTEQRESFQEDGHHERRFLHSLLSIPHFLLFLCNGKHCKLEQFRSIFNPMFRCCVQSISDGGTFTN